MNDNSTEDFEDPREHLLERGCLAHIDASKIGTPWRDPGAHKRGEAFATVPTRDTSPVTRRDHGDGRTTYFRGTGFYGGSWKAR